MYSARFDNEIYLIDYITFFTGEHEIEIIFRYRSVVDIYAKYINTQ